jgi:hypothetical protein
MEGGIPIFYNDYVSGFIDANIPPFSLPFINKTTRSNNDQRSLITDEVAGWVEIAS